ncbi:flavin-containing monooxygenase [Alterisphingorhabdus coralli]|uniref:NAD(P)/FAD-dependent oxidoreductase n=1 Tax=Alterisphingorhabdus coralli TaxID=3071408 RepID=A0AA97I190_9SPHN|nr:NAD(P)/FAD-dependent oxidoreductase [Parasphingorhabdus sp. SCSIO 66989]WOE74495.1 NAD(P)/FAD-dependent oxidoreductase [Parasphingorhabdus sp. SCSIO 66989]
MAEQIVDVLIAGAGISGIGMAVHLKQQCPGRSFAMIEQRDDLGGTWNLFQYPGIRSDSDMHTLGFEFEPWTEQKAIADGPSILNYLHRITDKHDLRQHMRFGHKILSANWSSEEALWTLTVETKGGTSELKGRFLYMGTGYYDYDQGYDPVFEGREDFAGQIVHPQFWPKDLDYSGKKVVVIGSGATAVTLVPNMADTAGHVTMLQRTPTWYAVRPAKDAIANFLRAIMPDQWAYNIIRKRNVWLQDWFFKRAKNKPDSVAKTLMKNVKKALGSEPDEKTYTPPYNPWDQRLCLVPDGDMFTAISEGRASIVTDHIKRFTKTGIELKSGEHLDADVIVTATGLKLAMAGKVAFSVDGEATQFNDRFYYKGCMFSNVPNMAIIFGYLNASWTLKVDIVANYVCRILNRMQQSGSDIVVPQLDDPASVPEEELFDGFSSGYVQRANDILPKQGAEMPWRLTQDYLFERNVLLNEPLDDGVLTFRNAGAVAQPQAEPMAEAAE